MGAKRGAGGMKTHMCDMCGCFVDNPFQRVYMRELCAHFKPSKKKRIHLCKDCWTQIAEVSQKKRSDTE